MNWDKTDPDRFRWIPGVFPGRTSQDQRRGCVFQFPYRWTERSLWDRKRVCRSSLIWHLRLPWHLMSVPAKCGRQKLCSAFSRTNYSMACHDARQRWHGSTACQIRSIRTSCSLVSIRAAIYEDIRIEHAKEIAEMDLDGYAVGGLAVGESHEEMYRILDVVVPYLPAE